MGEMQSLGPVASVRLRGPRPLPRGDWLCEYGKVSLAPLGIGLCSYKMTGLRESQSSKSAVIFSDSSLPWLLAFCCFLFFFKISLLLFYFLRFYLYESESTSQHERGWG